MKCEPRDALVSGMRRPDSLLTLNWKKPSVQGRRIAIKALLELQSVACRESTIKGNPAIFPCLVVEVTPKDNKSRDVRFQVCIHQYTKEDGVWQNLVTIADTRSGTVVFGGDDTEAEGKITRIIDVLNDVLYKIDGKSGGCRKGSGSGKDIAK
jgi:hypothetical protein